MALRQIAALTVKDLKLIFTDRGNVAVMFLMPLMFVVLMSLALGGTFGGSSRDRPLRLLAVNLDTGTQAAALLRQLDDMAAFAIETDWDGAPLSRETAEQLIRTGGRSLALVFPANFSAVLEAGAFAPASPNAPRATVELVADPATSVQLTGPVAGTVQGVIERASFLAATPKGIDLFFDEFAPQAPAEQRQALKAQAQQGIGGTSGAGGDGQQRLVTLEQTSPAGMKVEQRPTAFQQNVPGYTIFGIFWIVSLLGQSVLQEKREGTFRRLLIAPMGRPTLLIGKVLPYYLVNLVQIAVMLGAARLLFGMSLSASPAGLALVSLAAAATATGLGTLVAAVARTEQFVGGLTTLLLITLSAIGGSFIPRFAMPEWMRTLGLVTPHAWALDAYQDLLVRGYGLEEVLPRVGILALFALAFFAVGVWQFRFE